MPYGITIKFLLAIIIPVICIVLISSIGIIVLWIRFSWIKRTNSANYTGADLTQKMFDKANIDPQILNSFFYAKYWNHNKKKNTYRLRPWTYKRKSIWTMMEASQQAYATILRKNKPKSFWLAFRLPGFIRLVGLIISISMLAYVFINISTQDVTKFTISEWFIIGTALLILILTFMLSEIWMIWILRRDVPKYLEGLGLNEYEIRCIKTIFTWRLVHAISKAILQIIQIILRIALNSNSTGNKSK